MSGVVAENYRTRTALIPVLLLAAAACAVDGTPDDPERATARVDSEPVRVDDAVLVEAAERVVGFLRGERSFDDIRAADTVTLRLSPEGGGARASLPRASLADPAEWAIPTEAGERLSLIPPPGLTELTLKPGVHFNCMEYPLASRAPELAALPHVGVRLTITGATSCMQTWNLTLVFEPAEGPPALTAAVYDQWEW